MESLREVKEDLRTELKELRDSIKRLEKTEHEGVADGCGTYGKTGRYDMLVQMQVQLANVERVYKMLTKVKRMK